MGKRDIQKSAGLFVCWCLRFSCQTLSMRSLLSTSKGKKSQYLTFQFTDLARLRSGVMLSFTLHEAAHSYIAIFIEKRWSQ